MSERVVKKQRLGTIAGALEDVSETLQAPSEGMVIGIAQNPPVNRGDRVVHLANTPGIDGPSVA